MFTKMLKTAAAGITVWMAMGATDAQAQGDPRFGRVDRDAVRFGDPRLAAPRVDIRVADARVAPVDPRFTRPLPTPHWSGHRGHDHERVEFVIGSARFTLWRDAGGAFQMRTTSGRTREFHGSLAVEGGRFTEVAPLGLEGGFGGDRLTLGAGGEWMRFRFVTGHDVDGLAFRLNGRADTLRVQVNIDGVTFTERVPLHRICR